MSRPLEFNPGQQVSLLHNPGQQAFLQARRLRLPNGTRAFQRFGLIAGRRGGKTTIGGVAVVEESAAPNTLGWCVAPTYMDLNDYVIPAVFRAMPRAWVRPGRDGWSEQHQELRLRNGSKIQFRSGDDPERMRGPGPHYLWLDEARKMSKLVWDTIRPGLSDHRAPAWITTSPNGFDWIYHTFYKRALPGVHHRPGYFAVRYATADNPAIPREEIEEAQATMDPLWFEQEYLAGFVVFEGAIYGDRVEPCVLHDDAAVRHFLPEWPEIPSHYVRILGLDPGADHPFAAVSLVSTPRALVVIGEYLARKTAILNHATEIHRLSGGFEQTRIGIDRSALQVQIELHQHGVRTTPAENDVWAGIQRVQSWMATGQLKIVKSRCPQLIDQLHSYRWKDTTNKQTGERGNESVFKLDDDLPDALRYAIMTWPNLPTPIVISTRRTIDDVPEVSRWAWAREQRIARMIEGTTDWSSDLSPLHDFFVHDEVGLEGEELVGGEFFN
jgi:hypothetical protein